MPTSPTAPAADRSWFALVVRPRYEKVVSTVLRNKGFEEYLPLYRSRRKWCDRTGEPELPLFPGYVFCRLDLTDRRIRVLDTPGVIRFVSFGVSPVPLEEQEIAAVRTIIASGLAAEPYPYLAVGHRIRIEQGSLTGVEGIITRVKNKQRLVVSLTLLQRSVSVEIDRDGLVPVAPRPATGRIALARQAALEPQ